MSHEIKEIKFTYPIQEKQMNQWLKDTENKITLVGKTWSPYKTRTKRGPAKNTNIELVTIFYKEKEQ